MKLRKHTQQESGFTLLEIVVVVAAVLALSIGTVAVVGNSISKGTAERTLQAAVSTVYREAWDAETGFDENRNAETVVHQWNHDYENITFRASGESYELCVFAEHDDIDGEVVAGTCEENPAPEPEENERPVEEVEQTYTVQDVSCNGPKPWTEPNEIMYFWDAPSGWRGADMRYEVLWNDSASNAPQTVSIDSDGAYLGGGNGTHVITGTAFHYTSPQSSEAGTTTFTITPIVDGERLESVSFTTKEVDEPNRRECQIDDVILTIR